MRRANEHEKITTLGKYLKAVHIQDHFGTFDEYIAACIYFRLLY